MSKRLLAFAAGLAIVSFVAVACGGDDDNAKATATPKASASTGSATAATPPAGSASAPAQGSLASKIKAITIPDGMANGRKLGKDDAKVKVQVYEDFRCPHCLEFTAAFEQHLVDTYVKPGIVQFEFKYFPLSATSLPIMVAAVCADQQSQFWEYNKRLFQAHAESPDAAALGEAFGDAKLKSYAADLKLDTAKFESCLTADASLDPVAADYREAQALGIRGTPSVVVNGRLVPDLPGNNAAWKSLIEAAAK